MDLNRAVGLERTASKHFDKNFLPLNATMLTATEAIIYFHLPCNRNRDSPEVINCTAK